MHSSFFQQQRTYTAADRHLITSTIRETRVYDMMCASSLFIYKSTKQYQYHYFPIVSHVLFAEFAFSRRIFVFWWYLVIFCEQGNKMETQGFGARWLPHTPRLRALRVRCESPTRDLGLRSGRLSLVHAGLEGLASRVGGPLREWACQPLFYRPSLMMLQKNKK